jgi:hypothetical protein
MTFPTIIEGCYIGNAGANTEFLVGGGGHHISGTAAATAAVEDQASGKKKIKSPCPEVRNRRQNHT